MASVISRNDKFCVVYSYFDKDGKRRQKWETFKTLGEANTRKIEIEYSQQVGNFVFAFAFQMIKTFKAAAERLIGIVDRKS